MNCKKCIHNEVCYSYLLTYTARNPICCYFKDKSRFVELPCKVGDVVYQDAEKALKEGDR